MACVSDSYNIWCGRAIPELLLSLQRLAELSSLLCTQMSIRDAISKLWGQELKDKVSARLAPLVVRPGGELSPLLAHLFS